MNIRILPDDFSILIIESILLMVSCQVVSLMLQHWRWLRQLNPVVIILVAPWLITTVNMVWALIS